MVVTTQVGLIAYLGFDSISGGWTTCWYLAGSVLVAIVGWLDDLCSLSTRMRFAAYSAAAVLATGGVGYFRNVDLLFLDSKGLWVGVALTWLWVVGLTNAYNFMDGIDGIAGAQAIVAAATWCVLGYLFEDRLVLALSVVLAGASVGFLWHNWSPAAIFMGDVGSVFIGYTLAVLPLMLSARSPAHSATPKLLVLSVLVVWPFVYDTTFTLLRRLWHGENIFVAHRSHLYQRLVAAGYSHRFVTCAYVGLAMIGSVLAIAWTMGMNGCEAGIAIALPVLGLALWVFVAIREQAPPPRNRLNLPRSPQP